MIGHLGLLAASAFGVAAPTAATCVKTQPTFAPIPATASHLDRAKALSAQELWTNDEALVPALQAALAGVRADPDALPEAEAIIRAELSTALGDKDTFANRKAHALAAHALMVRHSLTQRPSQVRILTLLAYQQIAAGELKPALEHAREAIALARRIGVENSWEHGNARAAAGAAAFNLGLYAEALEHMAAAQPIALRCMPDRDWRIVARMSAHAVALHVNGRVDEAIALQFRAAQWAMQHVTTNSNALLANLLNLGATLHLASRLGEAEAVLRRVSDFAAQHHKDDFGSRADIASRYGSVLHAQGKHEAAEAMWLQAVAFLEQTQDKRSPATLSTAMRHSADAAERRGDFVVAEARRRQALLLLERIDPDHADAPALRLDLAHTLLLRGNIAEAQALAGPAMAAIRTRLAEGDGRRMAAEIRYAGIVAANEGPAAGYAIAAAVEGRLEAMLLDGATARGDLINHGALFAATFGRFAALALAAGHEDAAFRAIQLANLSQIVLATTDTAARAAVDDPAARLLVEQLQATTRDRRMLDRQRGLAVAAGRGEDGAALKARIDAADATNRVLAAEIDARFPHLKALGRPTPVSLADYRARLAPGEVLLAPLPLPDGTLAVAVTREGLVWQRSATGLAGVEALVRRIRASIDAATPARRTGFDVAAAAELYTVIVPPRLRPALAASRTINYFAGGALAAVPPALLVTPGSGASGTPWLVRSHAIVVLPTLAPPPTRTAAASGGFLGVGAPVLARADGAATRGLTLRAMSASAGLLRDLPSLPRAEGELRRMHAVLGAGQVLAGAGASEAALRRLPLRRFGVIAFATHGLSANDVAGLTEPALVLTPPAVTGGAEDDGLLTASEVAALRLDADWVILSACNTAGGGEGGAPEYAGLASAFAAAGARSLLVSHWPVRDDAAARLTVDTLRLAKTAPGRAQALRQAMLALMDDRRVPGAAHPAVWAPFVLVGR